jgi:hypothetical protein
MRIKMIKAACAGAHWIQKMLDVRVPMGAVNGLRTR